MKPNYRVIKFWTRYVKRDGKLVGVDMVEYCAPGMASKMATTAPISHLSRTRDDIDPDNPSYGIARDRWEVIGEAYRAWKAGREVPLHGTPLSAWPGVSSEQAEVLRSFGLKTVEDIAEASDSVITRVQLPGMRDLQANARRFLEASDRSRVADDLAKKDAEIAVMKEQMEELRQMLLEQAADRDHDGAEVPRRRGRPPKIRSEPDVAATA